MTGSVVGVISMFGGWLTLKPNRLVSGDSLGLWESFSATWAVVLFALWFSCLAVSLFKPVKLRTALLGITSNAILVLTFVLVGYFSTSLLEGEPAIARISPGSGFWFSLAGLYMVLYAARKQIKLAGILKYVYVLSGPFVVGILLFAGFLSDLSILVEFNSYRERFLLELAQHARIFGISVGAGAAVGVSLGILASRNKHARGPILYTTGIIQTVPSLALFGLLIGPLSLISNAFPFLRDIGIRGIGFTPAVIAISIYSLLPIVRNTYVGLRQIDPAPKDAGLGMGMSRWQVFRRVEMPLATPLVLEGIRTASVQAVGLATVAALIGAGGLGWFVFQGIGQAAPDLILLGSIPVIMMALLVDAVMRLVIKTISPKGLSARHL